MRPAAGQVLHFSEDPTLRRFTPLSTYVWAVDADNSPSYWFPRDCPRAMAWPGPETTPADRERIIGPGGGWRVHAVEYAWLERMRTVRLFAYRFDAARFEPLGEPYPHAMVSTSTVEPLGPPEEVGDLFALHAAAGIQLRVLENVWSFFDAVAASSLRFSGIRLRNAMSRTDPMSGDGRL